MRWLIRPLVSVVMGGGAIALAYYTLSPAVWSRETFGSLPIAASFAIGTNLAYEISVSRSKAPSDSTRMWIAFQVFESISYAGAVVAVSVLLGEGGFGRNLGTAKQSTVFVMACVMATSFFVWLTVATRRIRSLQADESEHRLAAARDEAKKNVDDFMKGFSQPSADDKG